MIKTVQRQGVLRSFDPIAKGKGRRIFGVLSIVAWLMVVGALVTSLTIGHWISLPHPEIGDSFAPAALLEPALLEPAALSEIPHESLRAFHFLYGDCPCSRRVLDEVIGRESVDGVIERIVMIGGKEADVQIASAKGYEVDQCAPLEADAKYGVCAAPLLVVTQVDGTILYSGGYTSRKQGPDNQDVNILSALSRGEEVTNLPVYGCAVSEELKQLVDPFRLKYSSWSGRE